jgi:hypothetical protein
MTGGSRARIASDVPGRLRVKVSGDDRASAAVTGAAHLEDHPGVGSVVAHPSIGSITIHYDTDRTNVHELLATLHDAGLVVSRQPDQPPADQPVGQSRTAVAVTTALDAVDRRISMLSARRFDLKLLFPATFLALGVRNTLFNGLGLTTVPGYVMLWYGFDAFYKLHQEDPAKPKGSQKAQQESAPVEGRQAATLS